MIVNNISVPNKKWTCTQCGYVDEAIMPPIKCPVCKGTDFVTT
nr:MAG TPA: Rubrerythrin [Bacteriophage sp.]